MPHSWKPRSIFAAVLLALLAAGPAYSQEDDEQPRDPKAKKAPPLRFEKIRVGFLRYEVDDIGMSSPHCKPGMFAPVRVTVAVGDKEIKKAKLLLETSDNETERTVTTQELQKLPAKDKVHFQGIVMPGNRGADVKATLEADDRIYEAEASGLDGRLSLTSQLILTVGTRTPDLRIALARISPFRKQNEKEEDSETRPRFAAYEDNVDALPEHWTGYQAVDMMILTTKSKDFMEKLSVQSGDLRLKAIAQWVRRGGRLVVSASWENQERVADLLSRPAWQPAVPLPLSKAPGDLKDNLMHSLPAVSQWAGSNDMFFGSTRDGKNRGIPLVQLTPKDASVPDWTVLCDTGKEEGSRPLIVRVPYGLGSITFTAFALDEPPFSVWRGRFDFWGRLVQKTCPRPTTVREDEIQFRRRGWGDEFNTAGEDLASTLNNQLDNFDVKIVPFGWVALFILLYILVVGPLDYVLLKYVFKRLEWTWITFPVVVFAVSFAAYFTAYAIKGKELRINQVDVVDFDLRTQLDEKQQPAKAFVYGQSFFTLLSPQIQNYTVGLEPNAAFWGQNDKTVLSADSLSWLGRSENDFHGVGSSARPSLFRRPYYYATDAVGLRGVPIPVWTTKCFAATWEAALPKVPLAADLVYHRPDSRQDLLISGKLRNDLPVDLEDVYLFYEGKTYPVAQHLPGKGTGDKKISLEIRHSEDVGGWATKKDTVDDVQRMRSDKDVYNPTMCVKRILFYELADTGNNIRDGRLRSLDGSPRLLDPGKAGVHDAVLYARVKYRAGEGEELYEDEANPMPTRLWLGRLPGEPGATRPGLHGNMNHDTYVRVLLPVRPAR